jgi:hypothetical protein
MARAPKFTGAGSADRFAGPGLESGDAVNIFQMKSVENTGGIIGAIDGQSRPCWAPYLESIVIVIIDHPEY